MIQIHPSFDWSGWLEYARGLGLVEWIHFQSRNLLPGNRFIARNLILFNSAVWKWTLWTLRYWFLDCGHAFSKTSRFASIFTFLGWSWKQKPENNNNNLISKQHREIERETACRLMAHLPLFRNLVGIFNCLLTNFFPFLSLGTLSRETNTNRNFLTSFDWWQIIVHRMKHLGREHSLYSQ